MLLFGRTVDPYIRLTALLRALAMAWTLSYVHDHGHYVSDPGSLIDPMNNRVVNHVWVTVTPS